MFAVRWQLHTARLPTETKNQCVTRQDSDIYFYSYNYQIYKREDIDTKIVLLYVSFSSAYKDNHFVLYSSLV